MTKHIRSKTLSVFVSAFVLIPPLAQLNAASLGPKLSVDCGTLEFLEDEEGSFKRFDPEVTVTYTGKKLNYWVYHTNKRNTPLSDQSRLQGYEARSGSANQRGNSTFDWHKDFRNSLFESRYYSSKYLEFTMLVRDSAGLKATYKCIYKNS